jgi:hypothetical protein
VRHASRPPPGPDGGLPFGAGGIAVKFLALAGAKIVPGDETKSMADIGAKPGGVPKVVCVPDARGPPEPSAAALQQQQAEPAAESEPEPEPQPQPGTEIDSAEPEPEPEPEPVSASAPEPETAIIPQPAVVMDAATPLLLQNCRVTAMLLAEETRRCGDPELTQLTDRLLTHLKDVVRTISGLSSTDDASGTGAGAATSAPQPAVVPPPSAEDKLRQLLSITGASEQVGHAAMRIARQDVSAAVDLVLSGDDRLHQAPECDVTSDGSGGGGGGGGGGASSPQPQLSPAGLLPEESRSLLRENLAREIAAADAGDGLDELRDLLEAGQASIEGGAWQAGFDTFLQAMASSDCASRTACAELCAKCLLVCNLRRHSPMATLTLKHVHGQLRCQAVVVNVPPTCALRLPEGAHNTLQAATAPALRVAYPDAAAAAADAIDAVLQRLGSFVDGGGAGGPHGPSEANWLSLREDALSFEQRGGKFTRTRSWGLVDQTLTQQMSLPGTDHVDVIM